MAVDETIGVEEAVQEFLQAAGTALRDELGADEVWIGEMPSDFANDRKAVVLSLLSERGPEHGALTNAIIALRCYGGTGTAANYNSPRQVYRALYKRLHNARATTTAGEILLASLLQGGNKGKEPQTGFTFYDATFSVDYADN